MKRRSFLQLLGLAPAAAVAPRLSLPAELKPAAVEPEDVALYTDEAVPGFAYLSISCSAGEAWEPVNATFYQLKR